MAFGAPACAVEISQSRFGVPGLEVGDVYGASPAFFGFRFSIVDERDKRGELLISGRKRRHAFVQPSVAHDGAYFFSVYVLRDQL